MNNVSGSFFIEMLVDGDSAQGNIRSTRPLSQMYNPDSGGCVPDWSLDKNDAIRPIIYPVIRSGNENTIKPIVSGSEKWYYNNAEVTFNASGLSTAPSNVSGKIQKVLEYDNGTVKVPAIKIVGNLGSQANMDADSIRMTGQIEASGHYLNFSSEIQIALSEYTDSAYNGFIYATNGGIIDEVNENIVLSEELYKGGDKVDTSNYTRQWRKLPDTGILGSGTTLTLTASDIDSKSQIICEFFVGGEIVASFVQEVSDETDPYFIDIEWTGSTKLSVGGSVNGQCKVKKVGSGEKVDGFTFATVLTNIKGETINITGAATSAGKIELSYANVKEAGGNITGYVTATKS